MANTFTLDPEFTFEEELGYRTVSSIGINGTVRTKALWQRPIRTFSLNWNNAIESEREYVSSFFQNELGGAGFFNWVPPDPIGSPTSNNGTVALVTAGSLVLRTYYYALTWETAAGETKINASTESSIAVPLNKAFRLTAPKLPRNVTGAGLYVGIASGVLVKQASILASYGVWQEGASGLLSSGTAPPAANTATETLLVRLAEDTIAITKNGPATYSMSLKFSEVI